MKLKLGPIADDTPVKVSVELRADTGRPVEPAKLVVPMLVRFIATDPGFARAKQGRAAS